MVLDNSVNLYPVYIHMSVINDADFYIFVQSIIMTKVHLFNLGIYPLPVDKNPFLLKTIKDVKTLPPNITKIEQSSGKSCCLSEKHCHFKRSIIFYLLQTIPRYTKL